MGDDQMPFSFDELLNWARSLVMVMTIALRLLKRWKFSSLVGQLFVIKRNQTVEKETGNAHRII